MSDTAVELPKRPFEGAPRHLKVKGSIGSFSLRCEAEPSLEGPAFGDLLK